MSGKASSKRKKNTSSDSLITSYVDAGQIVDLQLFDSFEAFILCHTIVLQETVWQCYCLIEGNILRES